MSLDLTNSDMLDCSPFAGEYSNIVNPRLKPIARTGSVSALPKPSSTSLASPTVTRTAPTVVRPTARPIVRGIVQNIVRNRPLPVTTPIAVVDSVLPSDMNVAPIITPVTPIGTTTTTTTTSTTTPTGAGAGAMGGGGASGGAETKKSEEAPTAGTTATAKVGADVEPIAFYQSYWFWGLLIGGVGAYFYAKNKGKKLLPFALVGAGIGGGVGFLVEKTLGKKLVEAPLATEVPVTEEAPATT